MLKAYVYRWARRLQSVVAEGFRQRPADQRAGVIKYQNVRSEGIFRIGLARAEATLFVADAR
jgi:hypothetical protein